MHCFIMTNDLNFMTFIKLNFKILKYLILNIYLQNYLKKNVNAKEFTFTLSLYFYFIYLFISSISMIILHNFHENNGTMLKIISFFSYLLFISCWCWAEIWTRHVLLFCFFVRFALKSPRAHCVHLGFIFRG